MIACCGRRLPFCLYFCLVNKHFHVCDVVGAFLCNYFTTVRCTVVSEHTLTHKAFFYWSEWNFYTWKDKRNKTKFWVVSTTQQLKIEINLNMINRQRNDKKTFWIPCICAWWYFSNITPLFPSASSSHAKSRTLTSWTKFLNHFFFLCLMISCLVTPLEWMYDFALFQCIIRLQLSHYYKKLSYLFLWKRVVWL